MLKPFKSMLTATMLSAVAITPIATVSFMASAEIAEAKGKKEKKEKKDRGGRAGKAKGGKPAWVTEKAKKNGGKPKGNGKAAKLAASDAGTECEAGAEDCTPETRPLHPSELGNMNGALNASENAILAHIRNGNTNGPVGHMAALAVAGYDRDQASDVLNTELAQDYAALDAAVAAQVDEEGNPLYENYADYLASGDVVDDIDNAADAIGRSTLDNAVADSEYGTLDEYIAARDASAGSETPVFDANIEAALSQQTYDAATAENYADASDAVQSYDDALAAMQAYWNKGDADSENADDLAALLEQRLASYENVAATVEDTRAEDAALDDPLVCDAADPDCVPDETALLDE